MFKPHEIAAVRKSWQIVTILPNVASSAHRWPVATSGGVFDESELTPAHPTVIEGASGVRPALPELTPTTVAPDGMSWKQQEAVEKLLKGMPIEFNGHWKRGSSLAEEFRTLREFFLGMHAMKASDATALLHAVKSGKPLDGWIPFSMNLSGMGLRRCSFCGAEDFALETDGSTVRIVAPCPYPDGLAPTEWELNVPSGRLVVANDLRGLFPIYEDFSANTLWGCRQTAVTYAKAGLSHAFVGNTCPSVYRLSDESYKIANPPASEVWDEKKKKYVSIERPPFDGKKLASICTDLWWYSICDGDEFDRRLTHFKAKKADFDVKIIKVPPGVYRFRHDEEAARHEGPSECVYTTFEKVRPPDAVVDLLDSYRKLVVNPHPYVISQVAQWPTLFGRGNGDWSRMNESERLDAWRAVADHVMCVIGGGTDWHEDGFPLAQVIPAPDLDPPSFRQQYHWYPFSKPYGGLFRNKLSTQWAKLAFRVLESVISFGMQVHDGEHSREVHDTRERMRTAVVRYRELARQYPEAADAEYVSWLSQKGRAESWVKKFPLGPEFTDRHRQNVERQRWVPEDAYAVAFDARKLKDGHFAWHPSKGGCWAAKKDAQRYAILEHSDNGKPAAHNCFWAANATNTSVPLYCVARVVGVGGVSHMGETIIEVAFDYGTSWMKGPSRKAFAEEAEKAALRVLSKAEYSALLPAAVTFFEAAEAAISKASTSKTR